MNVERPEAVLFDKDGTILPFDPFWTTWTRVFRAALDRAVVASGKGGPRAAENLLDWPSNTRTASHGASLEVATMGVLRERVAEALIAGGVTPQDADRIVAEASVTADADAARQPVEAHHGFAATVRALRAAGIPAAVVTGDDERRAVEQMVALGLGRELPVVVGGDRGLPGKPDPATLLAGCAALEVDPAGCVYVGDSLVDVRAARAAGFALALVYVPPDAVELPGWSGEADAVIRGFDVLAARWTGATITS
jgi:HAD superfamily hydrolase (TIGR01549 family)